MKTWVVVVGLVCLPGVASALSPQDQQKMLSAIDAGRVAYDRGDFAAALKSFEQANAIFESASIWYKIGLCRERLGLDGPAIQAYTKMLKLEPNHPDAGKSKSSLERLRKRVAAASVGTIVLKTIPPEATVTLDGTSIEGPRPLEHKHEPGEVTLEVKAPGYLAKTRKVEVRGGERVQLEITLEKEPPKEVKPIEPPPEVARASEFWGPALGITGGVVAIGAFSARFVLDGQWETEFACAERTGPCQDLSLEDVQSKAFVTNALTVAGYVGVALGVAGAAWWILDAPSETAVSVGPTGLSVSGRF